VKIPKLVEPSTLATEVKAHMMFHHRLRIFRQFSLEAQEDQVDPHQAHFGNHPGEDNGEAHRHLRDHPSCLNNNNNGLVTHNNNFTNTHPKDTHPNLITRVSRKFNAKSLQVTN
jgi:hypothetical protein